jgi:hypothetical protein
LTIATLEAIIQELEIAANTSAIDVADWPNVRFSQFSREGGHSPQHLTQAFFGLNPSTFVDSVSPMLSLVDGETNGEAIPISPLLITERHIDVIVAIDASGDSLDQWPE